MRRPSVLALLTPADPLAQTSLSIALQKAGHVPEAEAAAGTSAHPRVEATALCTGCCRRGVSMKLMDALFDLLGEPAHLTRQSKSALQTLPATGDRADGAAARSSKRKPAEVSRSEFLIPKRKAVSALSLLRAVLFRRLWMLFRFLSRSIGSCGLVRRCRRSTFDSGGLFR